MVQEKKKVALFHSFSSPPQAPHFLKRWGSQHSKRNHESIALPVLLIGLGILDRPNYDEGETERIMDCYDPHIPLLLLGPAMFSSCYPL